MVTFIEAFIVLLSFLLGVIFDRFFFKKPVDMSIPGLVADPDAQAMNEQQKQAVNYLLNYSADIAYGSTR